MNKIWNVNGFSQNYGQCNSKITFMKIFKILRISKTKGLPVMKKILMNKTIGWLILP